MNLDSLRGKNLFLTGGTGFFGKSILDMLKKGFLEETVFTILSRDPEGFLKQHPEFRTLKNVKWVNGDIRTFAFPEDSFDGIIHAATPAVTTLLPGEMRNIIIEGSQRVLEFALKQRRTRILFVSSGAVYGPQPDDCKNVAEDFSCAPVTEYGIAKLEAEKLFFSSGIETVVVRCFAFIGARLNLDIHFAVGNFLRNCLNNEKILIKGDGTPYRSYLYADDLVEWLFAAMAEGFPGTVYNIGSPDGISIADLAVEVASHFDPAPEIEIVQKPLPGKAPARYVPDVSKAQNELGVKVKVSLPEAIELCKNFHLARKVLQR